MRAEDLKGWLEAARRGEKEREANTKDEGDRGGEQEVQTEAEGHWGRVVEIIHEGGSTPHPIGVAPPSGVVQGGSRPPPTTRSSYLRPPPPLL